MKKQNYIIPVDLLNYFQSHIVNFNLEAIEHQRELVKMVWLGNTKPRQHHHFEGAISFSHKELDNAFGRNGFKGINERLEFFRVSSNWASGIDSENPKRHTKGYWLTDRVNLIWQDYLKKYYKNTTNLVMANGKIQKTILDAVAAQDMQGKTTTAWGNTSMMNRVKVDLDMLESVKFSFTTIRDDWWVGRTRTDQSTNDSELEIVERSINSISQIIKMAVADLGDYGYVPHRYVEAASGRLYANGINLQTAPTVVKQAALNGLWEYDFSNCHFDIIMQMARKYGYECKAINDYMANKQATRQIIALQAGITEVQAKTCLLAVMFGAKASTWHENAIPQEIGVEAATRLYRVTLFTGIQSDVVQARKAIVEGWKRTANGSLTNAFGKAIRGDAKKVEQLAHIIQGVEAKALQVAIDLYPREIVLLQHDGFAASEQLNRDSIMEKVFEVTGYQLDLEENIINVDIDELFQKYELHHNQN